MTCTQCNAKLPGDAAGGLCPRCALLLGLATAPTMTSAGQAGTGESAPFESANAEFAIGPYRTLRLLGAGGMGAVYLAEQTHPIRRQVALKIIKPGMGSAEIIRRFEAERQALALMDHPNIARVLDAGTTPDGRPYFVMEYVPGIPLTAYCDHHQSPARDRLRLFADVCRAIHHAHQKGVIHRDIKPTNVLVAERDGKPVVTVIDFGIAKAIDHQLAGETVFTRQGLLIGTPEYMSPEQASSSPDIDTTTDVYSLGVLLYELLTGVLPFDPGALRKQGFHEILRVIRETDPPRPVTRLRAMGDTVAGMAERRDTTVGGLLKQVQGDLEWITMRALEKDRARRYSSAAAMADDIERHLRDEPVMAGPPGRLYQVGKFVRRNRLLAGSMAAVAASLVLGMALTTTQYLRAERQRALAESNAVEAGRQRTRAEEEAQRADRNATQARGAQTEAERSRDRAEAERSRAEAERQRAENETEVGRRLLYAADMSRAATAWDEANLVLLEDFLDRQLPPPGKSDLRGWEWFYWWGRVNRSEHWFDGEGPYVAFSPDGKSLATTGLCFASADTRMRELSSPQTAARIKNSSGRAIAYSPNGATFAVSEINAAISIRDSASGREVAQIPFTSYGRIAYSPDGALLAFRAADAPGTITSTLGNVIKLWDLAAGRERATLPGSGSVNPGNSSFSVDFSPDGKTLLGANGRGPVKFWDVATGQELPARIPAETNHGVVAARWSRDGKLLAEAGRDGVANVWDLAGPKKLHTWRLPATLHDLDLSPDGQLLAIARDDRIVMVYALASGNPVDGLRAHSESAATVTFSPDGRFLATGGSECSVRLWSVGALLAPRGPAPVQFNPKLAYSADGRWLVVANSGGTQIKPVVTVWDTAARRAVRTIAGRPGAGFANVDVTADGKWIAAADFASGVWLWDAATGREVLHVAGEGQRRVQKGSSRTVAGNFVKFSPSGEYLAAGHDSGAAMVVDVRSRKEVARIGKPEDKTFVAAFSPNGSLLATAGDRALPFAQSEPPKAFVLADVWDFPAGRLRFSVVSKDEFPINLLAFSPDGRLLATVDSVFRIELWNTATGQLVRTLKGAKQNAQCLQFSPDGRRLIMCDQREILIWDLANGEQVAAMRGFSSVSHAVFSPDGRTLAASDFSGQIPMWQAARKELVPVTPRQRPSKVE